MPFSEFISSGDLKFIIVFILLTGMAVFHFIKKLQTFKNQPDPEAVAFRNSKINVFSIVILILSMLSLLLGLMHSFYVIGEAGGVSPAIMYKGISYTFITPALGLVLYLVCRILKEVSNTKTLKA